VLMWDPASEFLRRNVDVILDDGFFYREHRMRQAALAAEVGADTVIHFVDLPLDQVRERLVRRNASLPRFNFHIDPATPEGFLGMVQRPSPDEGATVVFVGD
jgi:predicted kinase